MIYLSYSKSNNAEYHELRVSSWAAKARLHDYTRSTWYGAPEFGYFSVQCESYSLAILPQGSMDNYSSDLEKRRPRLLLRLTGELPLRTDTVQKLAL